MIDIMSKLGALRASLSKLSKRESSVLYVTVVVVSLVVVDRMIVSPVFGKLNFLNNEIREKEASIKKNMRILGQKDKIIAEGERYSSVLSRNKTEEEEATSMMKEVEGLANTSSVYLIDMKPGSVKKVGQSKQYIINLGCEAQMQQLAEFMYGIENSKELLTIEKYQIGPKSKDSSVARCTMTISKISL